MSRVAFGDLHTLNITSLPEYQRKDLLGRVSKGIQGGYGQRYLIGYKDTPEDAFVRVAIDNSLDKNHENDEYTSEGLDKLRTQFVLPRSTYTRIPGPFYGLKNFNVPNHVEFQNWRAIPVPAGLNIFDPNARKLALGKIEIYDDKSGKFQGEITDFEHRSAEPRNNDERQYERLTIVLPKPIKAKAVSKKNDQPLTIDDFKSMLIERGDLFKEYWRPRPSDRLGRSVIGRKRPLDPEAGQKQWVRIPGYTGPKVVGALREVKP